MPTDKERQDDIEFQKKIEAKLGKKFGHAIPKVDRSRAIENNFDFVPIDREKLKEPLKDINLEEYALWRKFNNRTERMQRRTDVTYIDEPGISDDEIKRRILENNEKLKLITKEQLETHPELFNDSNS